MSTYTPPPPLDQVSVGYHRPGGIEPGRATLTIWRGLHATGVTLTRDEAVAVATKLLRMVELASPDGDDQSVWVEWVVGTEKKGTTK